MSKIKVNEINYENYGKCVHITNDIVDILVMVDLGPRIIRYGFCGGENFMFNDINHNILMNGEDFDEAFGKGSTWYIYGGHRLWLSPEERPHSYYPDNEKVAWKAICNGVSFIPPAQKANDVQYQIDVTMSENSTDVTIKHSVTNIGNTTKKFSLWALSVLCKNGLEIIPQPDNDTELLGNRILALWPYSNMSDDRVYWGKKYITLRQDPTATIPFKLGINSLHGYAAYLNYNSMFVKTYSPNPNGVYPDFGVSFETYTNEHFLESETLGELCDVTPGSTSTHTENWQLFANIKRPSANDESAIDKIVEKYIK